MEPLRLLLEYLSERLASLFPMKRFARILGIIAGIGAIAWAMRDRFISLAVPRETEPPAFRSEPPRSTPSSRPADPQTSEPDDLTQINGIGPVFAGRLVEAGMTSFQQVASSSEETLAEVLGPRVSNPADILQQARRLAGS